MCVQPPCVQPRVYSPPCVLTPFCDKIGILCTFWHRFGPCAKQTARGEGPPHTPPCPSHFSRYKSTHCLANCTRDTLIQGCRPPHWCVPIPPLMGLERKIPLFGGFDNLFGPWTKYPTTGCTPLHHWVPPAVCTPLHLVHLAVVQRAGNTRFCTQFGGKTPDFGAKLLHSLGQIGM